LTKTFEGILKKRENSLEPALGKTKGSHVAIRNG